MKKFFNRIIKKILTVGSNLWIIIAIMSVLPALQSCSKSKNNESGSQRFNEIKDSVVAMALNIEKDVSSEGPKAWPRYFVKSDEFFMASDGQLAFPNYDSALVFVNYLTKSISSIKLKWDDLHIQPLAPGLALMRASFKEEITDTSGHPVNVEGYFTGTAKHTSAGWKLLNLHWSIKK